MMTSRQFCFKHPSGEDIYLFTLKNNEGTEVIISNYGAILTSFKVKQKDGTWNDIVLGFDTAEEYQSGVYLEEYPWMGCAVGRVANRIKTSKIKIDDKNYQLSQNRGNDQLHGGISGFDKKVWQAVSLTDSPVAALELKYMSPDGDEGYPGNVDAILKYELNDYDELSYEYHASTDQPTVVNLTHHSYFNLNNGEGTIDDHLLKIHAAHILEQDESLVANGAVIPVEGTHFDFREFKTIGKRWDNEEIYDQSFVIDNKTKDLSLVAEAVSVSSGTKLQVFSTEPVVHFYSGRWFPSIKGKRGIQYGPCSGFCLETHIHPNAVNIPHFPNTILRPGEEYYHKTVYKVTEMK